MKLPTWKECKENAELGVATPLEMFMHAYEPVFILDAEEWRQLLTKAINHVLDNNQKEIAKEIDTGSELTQLMFKLDGEPE